MAIEFQNSVWKGGEMLRRTLGELTGETFVYSNQEIQVPYPIGVINKISEVPDGLSWVTYDEVRKEIINQMLMVTYQVSFITTKERTGETSQSIFRAAATLNAIRSSWKSEALKHLVAKNKIELEVDANILDIKDVMPDFYDEENQVQVPANIEIVLHIRNAYKQADPIPCLEVADLPIDVNLDIDT